MNPNSPPPSKLSILGVRLDSLSKIELMQRLEACLLSNQLHHIITLNSLMILETEEHLILKQICDEATLVIPESSGIAWAASYLGYPKVERIPGIDLAFDMCALSSKMTLPIYFLGGAPGVAKDASIALLRAHPDLLVAGTRDGFFSENESTEVMQDIAKSGARLILVALGMPKQELWIHTHKAKLPPGVYVRVGGSFDVWAGRVKRAPVWTRSLGLEWLYRLLQEPYRWRRIALLPKFALKIASKK